VILDDESISTICSNNRKILRVFSLRRLGERCPCPLKSSEWGSGRGTVLPRNATRSSSQNSAHPANIQPKPLICQCIHSIETHARVDDRRVKRVQDRELHQPKGHLHKNPIKCISSKRQSQIQRYHQSTNIYCLGMPGERLSHLHRLIERLLGDRYHPR
jgi:hypothetical protein